MEVRPPQELQFCWKYHEDPNHFLEKLQLFFEKEAIPERRKPALAKTCLKGEAKTWAEKAITSTVSWILFRTRFLDHYDSIAKQSEIAKRLYGDDQQPDQDTFSFITERMALFDRVAPGTPEQRRIQTVVEWLRPELRGLVRARDYNSMHQLIEYAVRFEGDVAGAAARQTKDCGKRGGSAQQSTQPGKLKEDKGAKASTQKKGGEQQELPPPPPRQ